MRRALALLLVTATALLAGCPRAPAAFDLTSSDGGFRLSAPTALAYQVRENATAQGRITVHAYSGEAGGVGYGVNFQTLPEAALAGLRERPMPEVMAEGRDAMLTGLNASLIADRPMPIGGKLDALEITARLPDGQHNLICRSYFYAGKLYQVQAILPLAANAEQVASAERFLDSFKLNPAP